MDLPIREIHKALGEGRVSPLELVEEAAKRIESDDCNAFEAVLLDQARQEAAKIGPFIPADDGDIVGRRVLLFTWHRHCQIEACYRGASGGVSDFRLLSQTA